MHEPRQNEEEQGGIRFRGRSRSPTTTQAQDHRFRGTTSTDDPSRSRRYHTSTDSSTISCADRTSRGWMEDSRTEKDQQKSRPAKPSRNECTQPPTHPAATNTSRTSSSSSHHHVRTPEDHSVSHSRLRDSCTSGRSCESENDEGEESEMHADEVFGLRKSTDDSSRPGRCRLLTATSRSGRSADPTQTHRPKHQQGCTTSLPDIDATLDNRATPSGPGGQKMQDLQWRTDSASRNHGEGASPWRTGSRELGHFLHKAFQPRAPPLLQMPAFRPSPKHLHLPLQVRDLCRGSRHRPLHHEAQERGGDHHQMPQLPGNPPCLAQELHNQEDNRRRPENFTAELHGVSPPSTGSNVHLGTTNNSSPLPDSTHRQHSRISSTRTGSKETKQRPQNENPCSATTGTSSSESASSNTPSHISSTTGTVCSHQERPEADVRVPGRSTGHDVGQNNRGRKTRDSRRHCNRNKPEEASPQSSSNNTSNATDPRTNPGNSSHRGGEEGTRSDVHTPQAATTTSTRNNQPTNRQQQRAPAPATHQNETVRFLQWNINGLRGKQHLLTADAKAEHRDVILLQETILPHDPYRIIRGYRAFHSAREEGRTRGCTILVRDCIPCTQIANPIDCGEGVEVVAVIIKLQHIELTVYNIYNNPASENFDISEVLALCATTHTFIGGDFNAHHRNFGSRQQNRNGHHIVEVMANLPEVKLLNSKEPTHIAGGILDLTFISDTLLQEAKWGLHPHLSSDHFATCTTLNFPQLQRPAHVPKWKIKEANWSSFRDAFQRNLKNIPSTDQLDEMEGRLVTALHQAADTAIPKTKPTTKNHKDRWYYNPEVREYNHRINQARKLHRLYKTDTTRQLLRAAINIAKDAIKKIKIEKWLDWCSSWNPHTRLGKMWRNIHMASGKVPARPPLHPDPNGEANRLVDSFATRSSHTQLPQETRDFQQRLREERLETVHRACLEEAPTDTPFTPQELKATLKLRRDTAAGTDRITYSMIREAGEPAHQELLRVVNASYDAGRLPLSWKRANIVPIPKPNDPGSHRPISLLSCLGKTAEKMMLARLQFATGDLHQHIYAYTPNKGTRDCLTELMTTVTSRKAAVVFVDLEKAFELASAPAILESLAKRGVKGKLLKWTQDFLQERKATVTFQGKTSHTKTFENGTPQGSILSPFLFNILMENLVTLDLGANIKILCYADDIAIVTTGPRYAHRAQRAITRISQECQRLGMKINAMKTKALHLGSRKTLPPLRLHDSDIAWVGSHPYLGVWMDPHLTFKNHVAATAGKAKARLNIMRAITGLERGANYQVLRTYYIQAVRSVIEYGAPCLSTASTTAITSLEMLQNQAMRLMVGAPKWTRICTLQVETNIPPLATRLKAVSTAHLGKLLRQETTSAKTESIRQALAQDRDLFTKKTWASTAADSIKTLHVQHFFTQFKADTPHEDYTPPPPWTPHVPHTSALKPPTAKAKLSSAELSALAEEALQSAPSRDADVYYTDGSVDRETNTAASAFVHEEETALFRLPDGSSTLQTELLAILKALQHSEPRQKPVTIHTDSLGCIQALTRGTPRDNVGLITAILVTARRVQANGRAVHINWVPSHTGIPGNEEADTAAKIALSLPNVTAKIPPSLSSLKNNIKAVTRQEARDNMRQWASAGSPSAYWYLQALQNPDPLPRNLERESRVNLHRLRLGYKCFNELQNTYDTCPHCHTQTMSPLVHYIEDCPATGTLLNRNIGTAPDILRHTPQDTLIELVRTYPPPR